jgi:hypothetical protein
MFSNDRRWPSAFHCIGGPPYPLSGRATAGSRLRETIRRSAYTSSGRLGIPALLIRLPEAFLEGQKKLLSTNIITLNATTTISGAHRRIGVSRFSRDPSLIIDVFVPRLTCAAMLDGSRVRRGDYPTPIKSQSPLSPRSSYSNTPPHQLCARLPLARGGPVQSKPTSSPYEMGEAHQLLKGTAFFPPG